MHRSLGNRAKSQQPKTPTEMAVICLEESARSSFEPGQVLHYV
jgi:hypothetical protein